LSGLFFATQKYEVGMGSNGRKVCHHELLTFFFTYRPSPHEKKNSAVIWFGMTVLFLCEMKTDLFF